MGVNNFHKFIKEKYNCIEQNNFISFDNVYIDLNYCLHMCAYISNDINQLYYNLYKFIDGILQETQPKISITFACDGIPPISKMELQRKRRIIIKNQNNKIDTSIFTCGTNFMNTLELNMSNYLTYIKNIYKVKINFLDNKIDEAELKLKRKLMKDKGTRIFVTNDADVILMLSTLDNYDNVYVYCKNKNEIGILSIKNLIECHTNLYGKSKYPNLDFTVINIMMGNDYFPKLQFITFDKLWDVYKLVIKYDSNGLVNIDKNKNISFNKDFMTLFMTYLLLSINKRYDKKINIDTIDKNVYNSYMDGLLWCIDMYYTGVCTRYNYIFNHKIMPNPYNILINLPNSKYIVYKTIYSSPINNDLYLLIILPHLSTNKKYSKFIKKFNYLYAQPLTTQIIEKLQIEFDSYTNSNE